jgi:hypothetical protein
MPENIGPEGNWGLGVGLTTPPCKTVIVTKPSKKEWRPKPTPGCSAEEKEEEEVQAFTFLIGDTQTQGQHGDLISLLFSPIS